MKTITISKKQLQQAIKGAKRFSNEWHAELVEILLIPKIHARWQELNPGEQYDVFHHAGEPYREYETKAQDWLTIAGYEFRHPQNFAGWNFAKSDYYCHSSYTAWDGIRRNTISQFLESLRNCAIGYDFGNDEFLQKAKIRVV